MHAILYPNVLFLSVHKLMLVSFILCIELITFDSIFCTVSSLSLFIKFYLALIDCNIFFFTLHCLYVNRAFSNTKMFSITKFFFFFRKAVLHIHNIQ